MYALTCIITYNSYSVNRLYIKLQRVAVGNFLLTFFAFSVTISYRYPQATPHKERPRALHAVALSDAPIFHNQGRIIYAEK